MLWCLDGCNIIVSVSICQFIVGYIVLKAKMGVDLAEIDVCYPIYWQYWNLKRCIIEAFEMDGTQVIKNAYDKEFSMFGLYGFFSMLENCWVGNAFEGISSVCK